jgi:hypothetical protein
LEDPATALNHQIDEVPDRLNQQNNKTTKNLEEIEIRIKSVNPISKILPIEKQMVVY